MAIKEIKIKVSEKMYLKVVEIIDKNICEKVIKIEVLQNEPKRYWNERLLNYELKSSHNWRLF